MARKQFFSMLLGFLLILIPISTSFGLTTVKVGLLKLSSSAPVFIGMDKGFFEA
ncbi:MAG: hypothetical protein HY879_10400, partial [Deltaproteobacteria bacterium]|nr:hypothetical protein [Deltaproteobacteria bacterium]